MTKLLEQALEPVRRLRPASQDECCIWRQTTGRPRPLLRRTWPPASLAVREAVLSSLQTLALFPETGRRQTVEGVRKFVTRKYGYLVYDAVDHANAEIAILTIQHPARRRAYADA
jgi:toxin ParE1/3/4